MVASGPEADARRTIIAERLADHLLAHGLAASTIRPLAEAAGLSDRMLLYYFPDKAAAVAAGLEAVAARMTALLASKLPAAPMPIDKAEVMMRGLVLDDASWPYMQLWLELAQMAARGDPAMAAVARTIGEGFLSVGASLLDSPAPDRARDAARLLMATEGAVLLRAIGLSRAVALLD